MAQVDMQILKHLWPIIDEPRSLMLAPSFSSNPLESQIVTPFSPSNPNTTIPLAIFMNFQGIQS